MNGGPRAKTEKEQEGRKPPAGSLPVDPLRLLDSMGEAVCLCDAEGLILYTNAGLRRMFGYEAEELLGRHLSIECARPDVGNRLLINKLIERAKETGSWEGEWLSRRKGDGEFVTAAHLTAIEHDGLTYLLCVQREVARSSRPDESWLGSDARYRALVEASAALVWRAEPDGWVAEGSPSWESFTGQPTEESLGWGWLVAVHPDDREYVAQQWAEIVAAGQQAELDFRLRHAASAGWRLVRARAAPLRGEDGRITCWVGMNVDIEQRHLAELALEESEGRKSFLLALGDRLRVTTDATEVMAVAAEMLGQHLNASRVGYGELDEAAETIRVQADWSQQMPWTRRDIQLRASFGDPLTRELLAGNTVRVNDCHVDPRAVGKGVAESWASIQLRAMVAVPLVGKDRLMAFLYVHDARARVWTDAQVQLIEEVAERAREALERARAETALRASEERLRDITDSLPALISYVDAEQRYRFVNRVYALSFGLPVDEIVGRHMREVLGEGRYEQHRPYVERAFAGEHVSYESRVPQPSDRVVSVQHMPHFGANRRVIGMYSLVQDITEQKRIEDELRQSRDEFATVLDTVPALIFIATDPDCMVVKANRRGAEMLRVPPDGNVSNSNPDGAHHFRMLAPNGRVLAPEDQPVQRAARGKGSRMREFRIVFDDETFIDVHGNAVPLRDQEGNIRGSVAAFVEIGERKRAEDRLRAESRRLETLNRIGAAMVAELDLDRLLQMITDAGIEVIGASFGAFFYHQRGQGDQGMRLRTVSGADRADFAHLALPAATKLFAETFQGEGIVRSNDILADPRHSRNSPGGGRPEGHLPMRSYLGVPVVSRNGKALGILLFGHQEPNRFTARHERLMAGIAAQAAIAIDNANLFLEAQREIEQRKHAEDHQRFLIDELNHRVKNTLAIVQGVAQQSFRDGVSMEAALGAFEGRLTALASAHNALTRSSWEHARFRDIVEGALAPFHQPDDGRLVIEGADLRLQPKTAVSLTMAFHELATNAVKYGAWSNDRGRVVFDCRVAKSPEGSRIKLVWQEEGGPPVSPPTRKGFGSRMVERALAAELGGSVKLVFEEAGLRCEIDTSLPIERREAPRGRGARE